MSEPELSNQRLTEIAIAVAADAEFVLRGNELPLLVEAARVGRIAVRGLKDAIAGNYARITIDGQTWVRVEEIRAARAEAIEEAAKVADGEVRKHAQARSEILAEGDCNDDSVDEADLHRASELTAEHIADTIRALQRMGKI